MNKFGVRMPRGREAVFLGVAIVAVLVLYAASLRIPVFGDAYGYSYRTARWIAQHHMSFVPQGSLRGEQAMGHPSLFFWLWALLMKVFGDSLAVARLLPAMGTFMALTGTYLLGRKLSNVRCAGFLASAALFVSPLFITQSMRPMPDSLLVASIAWSIYFYIRGRYSLAALACFLGVIFREQAILLAGAFFLTELVNTGLRKPGRLALFASPLLVIIGTGVLNLIYNGYFFFPTYMGEGDGALPAGWIMTRFRFFAGHLLAEDFRWLLVVMVLASVSLVRKREGFPLSAVLILLLPAVFYPPGRMIYLAVVCGFFAWKFLWGRKIPSRRVMVMTLFPAMLVLFHVFIVALSMDPALDLFRYVMGAYPVLIAGGIALLWKYLERRPAAILSIIFILATASANVAARHFLQPETSLLCIKHLRSTVEAYRYAGENSDTVLVSDLELEMLRNPALGYNVEPSNFRSFQERQLSPGVTYSVVVSIFGLNRDVLDEIGDMIPQGSVLREEPAATWTDGPWTTECYMITPGNGPWR